MTCPFNCLISDGCIQPKKKFKALYLGVKALFYQGKTPKHFKLSDEELNKEFFSFCCKVGKWYFRFM
jgi:hypothetical protein